MCGIAGLIGVPGERTALTDRVLDAIRHRGPDDEGIERPSPSVTLIHTRLAVIDPTPCGHQPMVDAAGDPERRNWVTFNGEIFNFLELREELARAGHPSATSSDTETILHAYRVWGPSCVERFVGMFALAIYDATRREVVLYRDRLGIKPLYVYRPPGGGIAFASELRALLELGSAFLPPVVDPLALEGFFAQGAVQGEDSIIRGVTMLPPATWVSIDSTTGAERRRSTYWRLGPTRTAPPNRDDAVREVAAVAREAVKLRLISDVPLGLFLSGGVDSAALLALASETATEPLHTLSVGFDVAAYDESDDAAATAAAFGTRHQRIMLSGADVVGSIPTVLAAMDQPTVDGTNTYYVSKAARDAGLTVALSGLGGDELFGGYASFTDVPRAVRLRQSLGWVPGLGALVGLSRTRRAAKARESLRRSPDAFSMYALRRELFLPAERRALHRLPPGCDPDSGLPLATRDELRKKLTGLDEENQVSFLEIELYMRHMLLRDGDVFSMAAPIEYRVPFLDHRLVETVFSLPGAWKRPDPRPKPLLLDAVGSRLPAAVWQRRKRGFTFPWQSWLGTGGALAPLARDAAHDTATWKSIDVRPEGVVDSWRRFSAGDPRVSPLQMLAFITLRAFAVRTGLRAG